MPSSSTRRTGTSWAHSLLPTAGAAAKSKLASRASSSSSQARKRTALISFFLTNFFAIALSLSLILLLITVVHFGLPRSSGPPASRSASTTRRTAHHDAVFGAARVDLTTKKLYDGIKFTDEPGGAWKQGWNVTYEGSEWDRERLKVFVVPHSHNDPGWKLTVDEYYEKQSRHILNTIVEALSKDVRRKFIWEEMSYLERWWRDAPVEKQEAFTNLVKNGQLEIVGGGWVMNDEANSHYYSIIEQITEGNMWLHYTIGFVPRNSWAIDPFGYSPTMAYLLRRMGFENMLIQRTHYELKKELALHKNLEYIWRQSWDAGETTDIFTHMMPFYSYDIPHTCGPEPAICCQFDFARMHSYLYEQCPWRQDPVETTQENVQERAKQLLDQYRKKSVLYRTSTLLVPLGDDFRYINSEEAEAQFRNYQKLFDYINSNPSLNAEAKFGTLDDYFRCLREESERINYSRPGEIGSGQIVGFPSLSGDFFTYADREQDYWSGYYVSRPFFKAVDRILEQTLRSTEMMLALLLGHCQRAQCEKLATGFAFKLTAARRNLALFQHHDGVTGTAKDHVVRDYGTRMHTSLQDLQIFMSKAIELLLGLRQEKSDHVPSQFEAVQVRSKYDVQPVHRTISAREGTTQAVILFNPTEQTRDEVVMVVVSRPDVSVLDSNWTCVQSQVSPELQHGKSKPFTGRHRVHWKASIPALGLETYYIANGFQGCGKAKQANLKYFSSSGLFYCPSPYICSKLEGDMAEISNQQQTLTFNVKLGMLKEISQADGSKNAVDEEIAMYSSSGGAYLFKPKGDAQSIIQDGGLMVISEGPLMSEVYSYPKTPWENSPISHSTRLYNVDNVVQKFLIEKEYHVELLGSHFNDREMIVRYKTDVDNERIFYTDLNGFQMSRRQTYDKIPLQGNYYPMPSLAFMQGSNGRRFSVHSKQSLGAASLKSGWLEIMVDRRLLRDDGRGLGQGVMDNRPMNVIFHILVETNISSTSSHVSDPLPQSPSLLSHLVGAHLNYPLLAFVAKTVQESTIQAPPRSFSPLATSLPCDLHIVNLKVPRLSKYSQTPVGHPRFAIILQRRHWDKSFCHKGRTQCTSITEESVSLFSLFHGVVISDARATSLNLLHEDVEMLGYSELSGDLSRDGNVSISPMEIQAYKLEMKPHQ